MDFETYIVFFFIILFIVLSIYDYNLYSLICINAFIMLSGSPIFVLILSLIILLFP